MTAGGAAAEAVPGSMAGPVVVVAATRTEARAAGAALGGRARVVRVGIGAGTPAPLGPARAVLSVGLCGALDPGLAPGEAVIPSRVGTVEGRALDCDAALVTRLREAARRLGVRVHEGPLLTSTSLVTGPERAVHLAAGWCAVDMETARLGVYGLPLAAVRVVLDTPLAEIDPAWRRPLAALLRPSLWGQGRRLALQAPAFAKKAAAIVAAALETGR